MTDTYLIILSFILFVSYSLVILIPYSIAHFYDKIFKKRAFPFLFIISGILFSIYFIIFTYDISDDTSSFFMAAGGTLLAFASLRLYNVMTGGS